MTKAEEPRKRYATVEEGTSTVDLADVGQPQLGKLDSGHAYTEYGVMVDRRSNGLGFYLAQTSRDQEAAQQSAQAFAQFYPAEVMVRRVYVTDWQSLPGGTNA